MERIFTRSAGTKELLTVIRLLARESMDAGSHTVSRPYWHGDSGNERRGIEETILEVISDYTNTIPIEIPRKRELPSTSPSDRLGHDSNRPSSARSRGTGSDGPDVGFHDWAEEGIDDR